MARLVDCSVPGVVGCKVSVTKGGELCLELSFGSHAHRYTEDRIVTITPIDEAKYRSGGKAAAGAIIGGLLTGGIGLIAGAAIGGRRRQTGVYFASLHDGHSVVFEEDAKANIAAITRLIQMQKVRSLRAGETGPNS